MERGFRAERLPGKMIEDQITPAETYVVDSFEVFYRDRWQRIYRAVAVGVKNSDLAKEAVDEAMVRAYERWQAVAKMSNPEGWVFRVAMNWATSRLRRQALSVREWGRPVVTYQPEPEPGLVAAVRALPRRQRDVVIARCLLDMSEVDTANALGIPVGTVKSRLSRGLGRLKEHLA
ncbi:MAG TPA: SigE family RNA polymerase sigma factor [Acidimicrobiia bacterium]|nr:SigE family RNA polymerase sigma factor [Acidimicrobiia bacterium]